MRVPGGGPGESEAIMTLRAVAPAWHTAVLTGGIVLLSMGGARELSAAQSPVNRLQTYAFTAATELSMLAWIYFGMRMRKVPFSSLLGSFGRDFRSIFADVGLALVFWIGALTVLGTIGIFWTVIEAAITHHPLILSEKQPNPSQQQALHTLTQLAPANGQEIAAWILLCIIAGFAEEVIFRGYLQRQFTAWSRGSVAVGAVFSAILFGAAHGYQGARNMALLFVFGLLFSLLVLFRHSLRPGMFAHSWHDLFAGLVLAFLKTHHVL